MIIKENSKNMRLPSHKTKIVCTIGPSSRQPAMLEEMIKKGMNVARLNFSHGDHLQHAADIKSIREAAARLNRVVGILIDLPGVKMRIGKINDGPVMLKNGETVTLTTRNVDGHAGLIPVQYKQLHKSVSKDSIIFLNDGFIQLKVLKVTGTEILCRIVIGGPISTHKGINLPGAKILVNAVTKKDLEYIDFGLRHGVHTFGLSFVEKASDINRVREFARKKGKTINLVAKIERREALENLDGILDAADAVMIARGDLGIEMPTEQVPIIQKKLIRKANLLGKPIITATQMLGSMTKNVRPTRAEVNDVANAILDGTDAVMLSEETAAGDYPLEALEMMAKIAVSAEHLSGRGQLSHEIREEIRNRMTTGDLTVPDVISLNAVRAAEKLDAKYIITPTSSGSTARRISRFKPQCWILSFTNRVEVCRFLTFSYGMYPFQTHKKTSTQTTELRKKLKSLGLVESGDMIIIAERRISEKSGETDSMGIMTIE
jgi:pyruvate kinase